MRVRVVVSGTIENDRRIVSQSIFGRIEPGMLAANDERRHDAALSKSAGDGSQFDRFRPGADDQPDIRGTQYSP